MPQTIQKASRGFTYSVSGELEVHECPQCGVLHGVPIELVRYADRHRPCYPIHCPNGHTWGFGGRSWEDRYKDERSHSGRLAAERDQIEMQRRAQKGATTRAKKRHAAGVCVVCNRSFANVKAHMDSQHPDYDPAVA